MLYLLNDSNQQLFVGDGVSGVEICGIQFETGGVATEYIRTEATAAVGAAVDVPWTTMPDSTSTYALLEGYPPAHPFIVWDNRFADATPVASSTISGAAANLADFRPYTGWKPSTLPATVTVDCGSAKSADCLALYNHDLFSKGCTVEVRVSTDNFVASDLLVDVLTPTSDAAIIMGLAFATYRYWRLKITGAAAPTLTIAALGVGLEFPVGLPYGFAPLDRAMVGQVNVSEHGLPLGSAVLFDEWRQTLNFQHVDNSWLRDTFMPAWLAHLRGSPFLFAWDLTNHPSEIYLVHTDGKVQMPTTIPNRSNLTFNVSGAAL